MQPTEEDWSLLHSRARKIESCCTMVNQKESIVNANYWIEMTKQQLDFIKNKINSKDETKPKKEGVKVF